MSFKKLPLFLMSAVLLSGCTKGCESSKPAPTPAPAPAAPKSEAAVEQTQGNVAATAEDAEADNE